MFTMKYIFFSVVVFGVLASLYIEAKPRNEKGTPACECTKATVTKKSCPRNSKQVPSCGRNLFKRSIIGNDGPDNEPDTRQPNDKKDEHVSVDDLLCCLRGSGRTSLPGGKKRRGRKTQRSYRSYRKNKGKR